MILVYFIASFLFIGYIFYTEQTFGQRCASANKIGIEFNSCVERLVNGGKP